MICVRQRKATPGESPVAKLLRPSLAILIFLWFLLLDDAANELLLPAGLGTHRILTNAGDVPCHANSDKLRFCAEQPT